jgi:hypothetical protein
MGWTEGRGNIKIIKKKKKKKKTLLGNAENKTKSEPDNNHAPMHGNTNQ